MIFFKTRYEVKRLQRQVDTLTDMLRVHFDIKYTMEDFSTWNNRHPNDGVIKVSDGEWWHYGSIVGHPDKDEAMAATLLFRGVELKVKTSGIVK